LFSKYKTLLINFGYLNIVQVINYLVPILIIPYIISTIGLESFGLINYSISIGTYFFLVMDFGFSLYGVKLVKENIGSSKRLSAIFCSIFLIKIIVTILCFLILYFLVEVITTLREEKLLMLITFTSFFAQSLFPSWFFQGTEKMSYILVLTALSKLIYGSLLLLFLESYNYIFVPIASTIGWIFVSFLGIIIIQKKHKITIVKLTKTHTMSYLTESFSLFISQFSINFFRNINTILLANFSSNYTLGVFTTAEKMIKLLQSLQNPLGQVLYPYLIGKWNINNNSKESIKLLLRKISIPIILFSIISFFGFLLADIVVEYFVGEINNRILFNFYIMLPIILFGGLNYYFGILGLSAIGMNKAFMKAILITCFIGLFVSIILVNKYLDYGASIAFVITEIVLFTLIYLKIIKIRNG
jgi:PST family polysaccharide transporter